MFVVIEVTTRGTENTIRMQATKELTLWLHGFNIGIADFFCTTLVNRYWIRG